jgi:CHAD domain-containing protein
MMRSPVNFAIDSEAAGEEATLSLQARFPTSLEPAPSFHLTYFDTFDWRLHQKGGTLAATSVEGETILTWRTAETSSALRLLSPKVPAFAGDFPLGSFRDDLAGIIEMRRLLPVVTVEIGGRALRLLDDQDKTVARAVFQEARAMDPTCESGVRDMAVILRILPVRGYDAQHEMVLRFVEASMGLAPVEESELQRALAAIDRTPGDYSSKLRLRLDPATRADEATRLIHRTLLATIRANEEGTRHDRDSEFLHDFRVAVRRTRSALRQIKGVYPPQIVERFSDEFRWLGQVTGPTRDLDVYLLKMADYEATLPARVVDDLQPLMEFLRHRQHGEQSRLALSLVEERYRALICSWQEFLDEPVAEDPGLPNSRRPILEVASERIWSVYRRVRSNGRAIGPATPPGALHRLRIECKKLRYLLEFFRSLYDAGQIERMVGALKRLQDNLGDFNDYQVQQESLRSFADQMLEDGATRAETLMAMGRLVERLEEGQAKERRRFAERFRQFADKKNHARFKRLFKMTRGARKPPEQTESEPVPAQESREAGPEPLTGPSPDPQDQQ